MTFEDNEDFDEDEVHFISIVHIIFSTKHQTPYLTDDQMREKVFTRLGAISEELGCPCITVAGADDHVHVLLSQSPNISLDSLVTALKSHSAFWLRKQGGIYADFDWQESSVGFTISPEDVAEVRADLEKQATYHQDVNFKTELAETLLLQGIEFNDEVWE